MGRTPKGLFWDKQRHAWYLRVAVPAWLQSALGREVKRSLAHIPDEHIVTVAIYCHQQLRRAFMDLDNIRLFGYSVKELARLYVDGALSVVDNAKVNGYVYGGQGGGRLRDVVAAEIERLRSVAGIRSVEASVGTVPTSQQDAPIKIAEVPKIGLTLAEAGELYVAGNPDWSPKTQVAARGILADLCFILGSDRDIESISHHVLLDFRGKFAKMPKDRDKVPELKGMNFNQLMKVTGKSKYSATTVRKRMGLVTTAFRWWHKHEYITTNPAHDLIPRNKRGQVEEREAFTPEDIASIQSNLLRTVRTKDPSKYWVTLIGMYSGSRIGEISGLSADDIQAIDGIHCMVIRDTKDRSLKTASSTRTIPIHSAILNAGFLGYVDGKKRRLFFDNTDNVVSKWFNRKCKDLFPGRKVVFHSLRHTVASELQKAGISREVVAAILGHAANDMTFGVYGKGFSLSQLKDALAKLPY